MLKAGRILLFACLFLWTGAVSYTHLDVYKRQDYDSLVNAPDRLLNLLQPSINLTLHSQELSAINFNDDATPDV